MALRLLMQFWTNALLEKLSSKTVWRIGQKIVPNELMNRIGHRMIETGIIDDDFVQFTKWDRKI